MTEAPESAPCPCVAEARTPDPICTIHGNRAPDQAPESTLAGYRCGDCGSRNLRWTLGSCAGCSESLDGDAVPASRTEGMFHRRCWLTMITGRDAS